MSNLLVGVILGLSFISSVWSLKCYICENEECYKNPPSAEGCKECAVIKLNDEKFELQCAPKSNYCRKRKNQICSLCENEDFCHKPLALCYEDDKQNMLKVICQEGQVCLTDLFIDSEGREYENYRCELEGYCEKKKNGKGIKSVLCETCKEPYCNAKREFPKTGSEDKAGEGKKDGEGSKNAKSRATSTSTLMAASLLLFIVSC